MDESPTPQLSSVTRGTLVLRLAAAALSIPSLQAEGAPPPAALGSLLLVLALSLVPLLWWSRVARAVVAHPIWLALDLSAALVFLSLAGVGAPFVLATAATAFLGGLLYGRAGAAVTGGLLLLGHGVLALQAASDGGATPPAGSVAGLLPAVIGLLYPLFAVAGAALRGVLQRLARALEAEAAAAAREAATEERLRVARDLHDSVGKTLHGIALTASALAASATPDVADQARRIQDGASTAAAEARSLLQRLREPVPDGSLVEELARLTVATGVEVEVEVEGQPDLGGRARSEVVAAVGEALENVRRHARAETVRLVVRREAGTVVVAVVDDGCGFSTDRAVAAERAGRYGMVGVRERLATVGGSASWSSSPGGGTTVELVVPAE